MANPKNRTPEDRRRIERMLASNIPKAEIARVAKVNRHFVIEIAQEIAAKKNGPGRA